MSAVQCHTCRWWGGDKSAYTLETYDERRKRGACQKIHTAAALPDNYPARIYPVGTNSWLDTRYDFSCRDWEREFSASAPT